MGYQHQCPDAVVCWQAVVRTRGFHELSDVVLARVLRSDRLDVDELDLVQAVREWAHVSSVSATQMSGPGCIPPPGRATLGCLDPHQLASPIPHVPLASRLSWSAQYQRWLPCPCKSYACPC